MEMRETLKRFMEVWKSIIETKKYNSDVENLAMKLVAYKKLDLKTQEELKYFQYAEIFARYMSFCNPEAIVKKVRKNF